MISRSRLLVAALAMVVTVAPARGGEKSPPGRGEAFSDPAQLLPMPGSWNAQPLRYEKEDQGADIVISMDQDIEHTLRPIVARYAREKKLKIVLKESTCGIVSGLLAQKKIDVGGFCCPPGEEDRLPGLRFHTLGIVAKAFFVHPDNPVEELSSAALREIYRGRINRWSEVPAASGKTGPELPITAIGRLHCKKRPGHWRLLLDLENDFGTHLLEVGSIPDMIAEVGATRTAIGWEVLTMVNWYRGRVKILRIDGKAPGDHEALARLAYPFYRTYTISTWEGAGGNSKVAPLVAYLKAEFDRLDPGRFGFVSERRLRQNGWKFLDDELVGEPARKEGPGAR